MQALASARLARDWPAVRFHPGDLDWWAVQAHGRAPGMTERVRLWFTADGPGAAGAKANAPDATLADDPEPIAFGWFGPPGELDFLIAPDDPTTVEPLVAELVAWADERRHAFAEGNVTPLRAWVGVSDPVTWAAIRSQGLAMESGHEFVAFTGAMAVADRWPALALPPGLSIRPLGSDADIAARVACGRAAFPSSTMTVERYRKALDAWLYRPGLDLLAVAEDGRVVGFALGWLDLRTRVVELEPVGVHPDWHRRGVGREICRATLRVARTMGAERVVIAAERTNPGAMALYRGLGLAVTNEIVPFARRLTEPDRA